MGCQVHHHQPPRSHEERDLAHLTIAGMSEIQGSSGTSSIANTAQQPAIYPAPCYSGPPRPKRHLNGNHDFLSIFGLMPLYDRVVRPYLRDDPAKVKAESVEAQVQAQGQRADSNAAAKEGKDSATAGTPAPSNDPGLPGNDTSQADAGKQKRLAMPKTFAHYVEDLPGEFLAALVFALKVGLTPCFCSPAYALRLHIVNHPGKVKPPKRTAQISRDTVMRDQIFAPEKMAQRILPFERDVLDGAFAVQPGEVPGVSGARGASNVVFGRVG